MDLNQKYWLIEDVVSYFHPFEVYGKAGTEITIMYDHLDMMIVKDKVGNIFHSRTDNLSIHSTNVSISNNQPCQNESSTMESAQVSKLHKQKRNNRRSGAVGTVSPSLFD